MRMSAVSASPIQKLVTVSLNNQDIPIYITHQGQQMSLVHRWAV